MKPLTTPFFNAQTYADLARIVFSSDRPWPGYEPEVIEVPNGDGRPDVGKRYGHIQDRDVAEAWRRWQGCKDRGQEQYFVSPDLKEMLTKHKGDAISVQAFRPCLGADIEFLDLALTVAHSRALQVAEELGVPDEFMPLKRYGALRLVEYPAGVGGELHKDFDLFTIHLYRNEWLGFRYENHEDENTRAIDQIHPGMHLGELAEAIGLGPATPHFVRPLDVPQHAIVYFAIPDHSARLDNGPSVGEWLAERMSRSRVYR